MSTGWSAVWQKKARTRLFAGRSFEEKAVVWSYYRSLAYGDMRRESKVTRWYGEEYMEITAELSRRWVLEKRDARTDSREQKHQMRVVSAPVCAVRYINDLRYLP